MFIPKKVIACVITASLFWNSSFAAVRSTQINTPNTQVNAVEILDKGGLRGEINHRLESDQTLIKEIERLGIDKSEVSLRIAAMTDEELQQVQQGVQRQAGGDVVVISVTTLLVIILIILLVR